MENQNRFDLEKALRAWREDCASRSCISLEAARELESDLCERVADLQKQGLKDDEAFQEALRQVGSPADLAREFARENPWVVWHDRLLWMVAAGFAFSIWQFISYSAITWFLQTFGVLLPFDLSIGAAVPVGTNLPVLAIAALLASGRLHKLTVRLDYFLQSRRRLALTGLALLVVAILIMALAIEPLYPPSLLAALAWPMALLSIALFLFDRSPMPKVQGCDSGWGRPVAVWRERVCWMAVGALMLGLWQPASGLGLRALLINRLLINRLYNPGLIVSAQLLVALGPVIPLLLFAQRTRRGKDIPYATFVRRRPLLALLPAVLLAWTGLQLWSLYLGVPRGRGVFFSDVLNHYVTTFEWLWPVGLAALVLWLAPSHLEQEQDSDFAKQASRD